MCPLNVTTTQVPASQLRYLSWVSMPRASAWLGQAQLDGNLALPGYIGWPQLFNSRRCAGTKVSGLKAPPHPWALPKAPGQGEAWKSDKLQRNPGSPNPFSKTSLLTPVLPDEPDIFALAQAIQIIRNPLPNLPEQMPCTSSFMSQNRLDQNPGPIEIAGSFSHCLQWSQNFIRGLLMTHYLLLRSLPKGEVC